MAKRITKKSLGVLWTYQYAPREKRLLKKLNPAAKKRYKSFSLLKRITLIDTLKRKNIIK